MAVTRRTFFSWVVGLPLIGVVTGWIRTTRTKKMVVYPDRFVFTIPRGSLRVGQRVRVIATGQVRSITSSPDPRAEIAEAEEFFTPDSRITIHEMRDHSRSTLRVYDPESGVSMRLIDSWTRDPHPGFIE